MAGSSERRRRRRREKYMRQIKGSQVKNSKYAGFIAFGCFLILLFQLVAVLAPGAWFTMKSGMRYSAGALLPGSDLRSEVFDTLSTCYGIAEDSRSVGSFMWQYDTANPSPGRVQCDFKPRNTAWIASQAGQTAVVKMKSSWGCGILACNGLRESKPEELYECDSLGSVVQAMQAFSLIALMSGAVLFVLQLTLYGSCFLHFILWTVEYLRKLHVVACASSFFAWVLLAGGFGGEFCGRRLSRDANLQSAMPLFLISWLLTIPNVLLVYKAVGPVEWVDSQPRQIGTEEMGPPAAQLPAASPVRKGKDPAPLPAPGQLT